MALRREVIIQQITQLKRLVESQEKSYERACECLAQIKGSLAVTKAVRNKQGEPLTTKEQQHQHSLILEAYENVAENLTSIANTKSELHALETELEIDKRDPE